MTSAELENASRRSETESRVRLAETRARNERLQILAARERDRQRWLTRQRSISK